MSVSWNSEVEQLIKSYTDVTDREFNYKAYCSRRKIYSIFTTDGIHVEQLFPFMSAFESECAYFLSYTDLSD